MNPHATDDHARIAEQGTILRVLVGSGVHGTAIDGQDDRDEMGICIEPPEYVIGLRPFEQYVFRSQPEGVRSGPGDLDLTIYSLRKWTRLALQGNPTILLPLFTPDQHVLLCSEIGTELRDRTDLVISRRAGERFLGYLQSQRDRLRGIRGGKHTNFSSDHPPRPPIRPELVELYGFDTKYAMHMVRLGVQGVELLETGRITLPIPEPWLTWLQELRRGEHSKDEALEAAADLEARLEDLCTTSPLRAEPDEDAVNAWLVSAYRRAWSA